MKMLEMFAMLLHPFRRSDAPVAATSQVNDAAIQAQQALEADVESIYQRLELVRDLVLDITDWADGSCDEPSWLIDPRFDTYPRWTAKQTKLLFRWQLGHRVTVLENEAELLRMQLARIDDAEQINLPSLLDALRCNVRETAYRRVKSSLADRVDDLRFAVLNLLCEAGARHHAIGLDV